MESPDKHGTPGMARVLGILAFGTLAVSTAAPFIKLAGMHPLALTTGRLLGVALVYAFIGRDAARSWRALPRYERRLVIFGTPLLAAHFAFWIGAFSYTDLTSAVLLLVLQPLLASWFGARFFRERATRGAVLALGFALAGLALIAGDDFRLSARHLFGDGLVALGAVCIIGFFAVGKRLRPHLSFPAYMTLTYGSAGIWALALSLASGVELTDYPAESFGWLLGLILVTTGIGHAALNYSLPYARLFTVNLTTVAEPILSIAWAAMLLGATLTPAEVGGGALLIAAFFVGMRDEWRPKPPVPEVQTV